MNKREVDKDVYVETKPARFNNRATLFYCQTCKTTFIVTKEEYNRAKEDWKSKQDIFPGSNIAVIPPFSLKGHYPWIWREDQNYEHI